MTPLTYTPLPSASVSALRAGGPDANGQPAEKAISTGGGMPCRHCLRRIAKGAEMLILAYRPFTAHQPYAELGPVFLCADCEAFAGEDVPEILTTSATYLLKGYTANERICYGTGKIVRADALPDYAASLLARDGIAFVDVRSATNNCFLLRITQSRKTIISQ